VVRCVSRKGNGKNDGEDESVKLLRQKAETTKESQKHNWEKKGLVSRPKKRMMLVWREARGLFRLGRPKEKSSERLTSDGMCVL